MCEGQPSPVFLVERPKRTTQYAFGQVCEYTCREHGCVGTVREGDDLLQVWLAPPSVWGLQQIKSRKGLHQSTCPDSRVPELNTAPAATVALDNTALQPFGGIHTRHSAEGFQVSELYY